MEDCNIDAYFEWFDKTYEENLLPAFIRKLVAADRSNKKLWKAMDFESSRKDFLAGKTYISNGQMMQVTGILCRESLANLERKLAGYHGPVTDQDIHDAMCRSDCITTDEMRDEAMQISGCDCAELSTMPGDWCAESSGVQLCDEVEQCGVWQCSLNDFHCRRMEYNSVSVPLKGYGNECSSAVTWVSHVSIISFLVAVMFMR